MRRRTVLSTLALAVLPAAGCTAPGEPTADDTPTSASSATPASSTTASPDATPTQTEPTPDPDDPILFVLDNDTDTEQTVTLRLTRSDQTFVDETVTLDAGESREYDSGIRSPGEYELVTNVEDGPERTMTLPIDDFDVDSGANHYVEVTADGIDVTWQE